MIPSADFTGNSPVLDFVDCRLAFGYSGTVDDSGLTDSVCEASPAALAFADAGQLCLPAQNARRTRHESR